MSNSTEKRVGIFSNTFWSLYNFRRSLIKALLARGYQVVAVSADDRYRQKVEELGCQTVVLKSLDAKSTSVLKELRLILEVREVFRRHQCQYIYTFTIKPNLYTTLTNLFSRKKVVVTVNGLGNVFAGGKILQFISLQLFRIAFRQAHRIVFQNRDDYHFFQQRIPVNANKLLFVEGSGVHLSQFNFVERPPVPGEKLTFLMACRLLKEKGVFEYIEAARRLKEDFPALSFWLIGMPAINQSAISLDDLRPFEEANTIRLMPPSDNMSRLLEQVDAVVLPSYYNEGVPRILLEGLSKGLPLITTNSVGCKETVVSGKNGFLIAPRNVDALESALRQLIMLPAETRLQMGCESRRLAEVKFDERKVIESYVEILPAITARTPVGQVPYGDR